MNTINKHETHCQLLHLLLFSTTIFSVSSLITFGIFSTINLPRNLESIQVIQNPGFLVMVARDLNYSILWKIHQQTESAYPNKCKKLNAKACQSETVAVKITTLSAPIYFQLRRAVLIYLKAHQVTPNTMYINCSLDYLRKKIRNRQIFLFFLIRLTNFDPYPTLSKDAALCLIKFQLFFLKIIHIARIFLNYYVEVQSKNVLF